MIVPCNLSRRIYVKEKFNFSLKTQKIISLNMRLKGEFSNHCPKTILRWSFDSIPKKNIKINEY